MIRFDATICRNLDTALKREWLETNGLGGFASSTIAGLNTRRYHGLLTAATKPPVGRVLMLSQFEETVITGGERFELSANRYPGAIHPQGFQYLAEFRLDPFPVFVYRCGGGHEIVKRVFMVHGENTVVVQYDLPASCSLELKPLVAFRDYHSTTHENSALNRHVDVEPGVATVQPYADLPALHFAHNASSIDTVGDWYRNFEYSEEKARGLDYVEDLFNPMTLRFDGSATVIASMEPHQASEAAALGEQEIARRASFPSEIERAADQFIVKRGELKTMIAGYHWFSDWGRDTMISALGLTLATKRYAVTKSILEAFANAISEGMLPNRFPDAGETPEYNTVDATLWFFEAIRAYHAATGDGMGFVPHLADIIDWHVRGTRYGIRVDDDGLVRCGEAGVQLTWMDAKVGDWVVTPRQGKPVEIQALWYNALCVLFELTGTTRYQQMAASTRESFNAKFWNADTQCLYDVIDGDQLDGSIRPNQIFAAALPHSMLTRERASAIVDKVRRELLTPMGLRTLAPGDANYHGRYEGGQRERDGAYHQGTVWPWLIGPFVRAFLLVNPESRAEARTFIDPLLAFMQDRGLGQLPEIADGDAPHEPRGCIAQAWSVSEVLRVLVE